MYLAVLSFLVTLSWLYKAYVFKWLWLWFLVPLGAPPLEFNSALGITLILSLLTTEPSLTKIEHQDIPKTVYLALIYPTISILLGWFMQNLMKL